MATAATAPNYTTQHLRTQITHHLDLDLPETANFLAGRLHALEPRSPDSAHLLALTYYRLRRFRAAADYAHKFGSSGRHLGCAYVYAQACLQLSSDRYAEGIAGLEKSRALWTGRGHWQSQQQQQQQKGGHQQERRFLPDAAAVLTLLGKLWQAHGDPKKAGDCFVEAHKGNPFAWEAFEGLCKVGADLKVENMFKATVEMAGPSVVSVREAAHPVSEIYTDEIVKVQEDEKQPLAPQLNFNQQVFTPSADPFASSKLDAGPQFLLPNGMSAKPVPISDWDTPTTTTLNGTTIIDDEDIPMADTEGYASSLQQPPAAPARRVRPGTQFEASERPPRQPALRGQLQSTSEGQSGEAGTHLRKPSLNLGGHKRTISGQQPTSSAGATDSATAAPMRRSNRLFGQSTTTTSSTKLTGSSRPTTAESTSSLPGPGRPAKTATGTKGRIGSTVGRVVSGNRKILPPERKEKDEKDSIVTKRAPSRNGAAKTASTVTTTTQQKALVTQQYQPPVVPLSDEDNSAASLDAIYMLLSSLRTLAIGTYATTRFDTNLALKTFRGLSSAQRETPYVLAQLGRAHYEAANYNDAAESFARCLKLQPSRVKDMEVYSTVLWHLKKDAALAFLCHSLRDTAPGDPETWVAVGNAFSLSREHDSAIAAFRRAVQIEPKFAYAWALMGHEYIANEDFDAALSCFRHAVFYNRRGFGGWYGLGKCYERVGKLEDAERHYRIASSINPSNATLLVCVGVVLEKLRNRQAALANYSKALELAPNSALARFKKARVLMHLRCYDEALLELEVLKGMAGEEANVWFLLGKCYKGLGMRGEGVGAFTRAVGLDVKVSFLSVSITGCRVGNGTNMACRLHLLSKKQWKQWMRMRMIWTVMTTESAPPVLDFMGCIGMAWRYAFSGKVWERRISRRFFERHMRARGLDLGWVGA